MNHAQFIEKAVRDLSDEDLSELSGDIGALAGRAWDSEERRGQVTVLALVALLLAQEQDRRRKAEDALEALWGAS